jgi:Fe-S cluster assembly iron-binding protein IscA/alpha/beta superfamily hydrolase
MAGLDGKDSSTGLPRHRSLGVRLLRSLPLMAVMAAGCGKSPRSSGQPPERPPAPAGTAKDTPEDEGGNRPGRKDVVALTPAAAAQVRKLMGESGARYLRVSVAADGQYKLDLDERTDPNDDYLGESRGVPVVVDRKSARLLPGGITVDFVTEGGKSGFKFSSAEPVQGPAETAVSLVEARRGFTTTLARRESGGRPAPQPPPRVFRLVRYDAPPGKLAAYLTPDPGDGKKHPAIVWITGGDCNSIGECWLEAPPSNDQTAAAYRKAGLVMMFPSLRGGNDNPGVKEGFLGEVDDVLAAAEFLGKQPYVDPDRVYLGGHSTGGTLVLLTAECSDRFRAVFSFGPVDDVAGYGPRYNPFVLSDPKELRVRAPGRWLHCVRGPVFVFEGTGGNIGSLRAMARASKNPHVHLYEVKGADHFNVLAPTNRLIAEKILADTGPTCRLAFTEEELNRLFAR